MEKDAIKRQLATIPQLEPDKVSKLSLARAKHTSETLSLSQESQKFLEQAILNGLAQSLDASLAPKSTGAENIDLLARLQKMRHNGDPWCQMAPVAFDLFQKEPSAQLGAHIIQLAIMNGSHDEICATFVQMMQWSRSSYWLLAFDYRSFIVCLLWHRAKQAVIAGVLTQKEDELLAIEQLCLFFSFIAQNETLRAVNYYHRNAVELRTACIENEMRLGLSLDEYFLTVGTLLCKTGYEAGARSILGEIRKESAQFKAAGSLMLSTKIERDASGDNLIIHEIKQKKVLKPQLRLLAETLERSRKKGPLRSENLPALNETLAQVSKLFPQTLETYSALARLLADQAAMLNTLPALFTLFEENVRIFHNPELELALWQPLITIKSKEPLLDMFWQGVAHFHCFMAKNKDREKHLWAAFTCLSSVEQKGRFPLIIKWSELNRLAYSLIAKDYTLSGATQSSLLGKLDLTLEPTKMSAADIDQLLVKSPTFPLTSLGYLRRIASEQNRGDLELKMVRAQGEAYHYTSGELDRFWHLASREAQYDLAWTTATILLARGDLHEAVKPPWQLSYEGRGSFSWLVLPRQIIAKATTGLTKNEAQFIEIIADIGPKLPALMAGLDPKSRVAKIKHHKEAPLPSRIEAHLDQMSWLSCERNTYYLAGRQMQSDYLPPPFVHVWQENPWSWTVLCLARRLGFSYFEWSTQKLSAWLDWLKDELRGVTGEKSRSILGKWLHDLTPEQKRAWHELTKFNFEFSSQRGEEVLAHFVILLATLVHPHHLEALTSLASMQAPVTLLWGLEKFLLSENYMQIRQQHALRARAAVPQGILRLLSIRHQASPVTFSADE